MHKKTIFLDRDGVVNKEVNYLRKIKDFKFINGVFDSCTYFLELGYEIIIITNQSGIAKGYLSENDFDNITKWMFNQFKDNNINILDVLYCPHNAESNCECRKPKPGMLLQAKNKHNINMQTSWMIGDKESDIKAANAAGIDNTILVRSGHKVDQISTNAKFFLSSIKEATQVITS
jgi:D-glycero-D-manno-heptose 1,7-bisphosphate phosphatase